jgi:hypothetical protein
LAVDSILSAADCGGLAEAGGVTAKKQAAPPSSIHASLWGRDAEVLMFMERRGYKLGFVTIITESKTHLALDAA